MNRAVSVSELISKNFNVLEFDGVWRDHIGCPELAGSWLIWGNSGNGKTRYTLQLCKYLTKFGKVAYNSLEEGACESIKQAFIDLKMKQVARKFILLDQEPIEELKKRLHKRKSPDIIVIDSVQYTGMNYEAYRYLRTEFPKKLFIMISHADGKSPAGRVARAIRFDSFVKIWVEGYKAFPTSRYGGITPYTVWEEGAKRFWGNENQLQ